ncbi:MAG TPA: hypothetical protein VMF61_05350 [Candidatus Acidoferrales bacterium]|nr:hypothetical protein [Candidatus Acidoferrales bacterium]
MSMRQFLSILAVAVVALAPCAARSQTSAMASNIGVGPHGYDFAIGTWSCTNAAPSGMSGPATSTLTLARNAQGSLTFHSTGAGFDTSGYVAYNSKSKMWWNPAAFGDGSYSVESTRQKGSRTVWTGTFFDASTRTTTTIRDTYSFSPTKYTDLGQMQSGGGWKTVSNLTCTKS